MARGVSCYIAAVGWGDSVLSAAAAAACAATLEELSVGVVPRLRDVAGAACASLYRYDSAGRLSAYSPELDLSGYSAEAYRADPAHRFGRRLIPRPRVVHVSRQLGTRWARNPVYAHYYRPRDFQHVVCMWLTGRSYGQPGFVGVFFSRTAKQGDFPSRALTALDAAMPAVAGAVGRTLQDEALLRARGTLEAALSCDGQRPVMVFDCAGRLLWSSPQATAALAPVPERLVGAVRRLVDAARGQPGPVPVTTFRCAAGPHTVRINLSLSSDAHGKSLVIATLDFVKPDQGGVAAVARRHGLTPAETRVLAWMLTGASNRRIAAQLAVSLETVRTHSKHVLGKLAVANRFQAALLLMSARAPEL